MCTLVSFIRKHFAIIAAGLSLAMLGCWALPFFALKPFQHMEPYSFFWVIGDVLTRFPAEPGRLSYTLSLAAFALLPFIVLYSIFKPKNKF